MADKKISQLTNASTPLTGVEVLPVVQSSATVKVSVNNLTVGRNVETAELTAVKTSAGALIDALVVRNESTTANAETGIFFEPTANIGKIRGARISAINDGGNVVGLKFYTGAGATITSKLEIEGATTGNVTLKTGNLVQGTAAKGINFTANTPAAGMTSQLLNWYEEGTFTPNQGAGLTVVGAFSSAARYTRIGRVVTIQGYLAGATSISVAASGELFTNAPFTTGLTCTGSLAGYSSVGDSVCVIINGSTTVLSNLAIGASSSLLFTLTYSV